MLHPHTIVRHINDIVGYGVFATEFIPRGTITWVRDALDRELTSEQINMLPEAVREAGLTYAYRNAAGNYILPWDNTRFVNHSFYANTMLTPYGFEIAIADINKGEQITNDYGTLNIIESFEPVDEGHERKWVHPDDIGRFHREWDDIIQKSIVSIPVINQPLAGFFNEEAWEEVLQLAQGNVVGRSVLECLIAD